MYIVQQQKIAVQFVNKKKTDFTHAIFFNSFFMVWRAQCVSYFIIEKLKYDMLRARKIIFIFFQFYAHGH